jgi:hypothetical protein
MVDFLALLRTAMDNAASHEPEARANIYNRSREAIGRLGADHSPAAVEKYRLALEEAIAELERSYQSPGATLLPSATKSDAQQSELEARSEAAPETPGPRSQDLIAAAPSSTATERDDAPFQSFNVGHMPDNGNTWLPVTGFGPAHRTSQTLSYTLNWPTSNACSICRKVALCIDSAHCWNRD